MSGSPRNVGTTLTGGIQDIAALLPLLGTDQCEMHVGSALEGGYLYAAAAPMSIFGSLGIVKIGISVLISSISVPKLSISYRPFSVKFSQDRWLGARTLENAGFKPAGTVAAMIAMDGTRYKAETRLMQILDEKHVDNPENVSIEWKSRDWNVALILFTIAAGAFSGAPYIALLLQDTPPTVVHIPWIFPLLRTVGSCLAAVCCQFLIQSRVIYLMKSRIVFLIMHRILIDDLKSKPEKLVLGLKEHLRWDADLPAEQCLWFLKQFLFVPVPSTLPSDGPKELGNHVSITMNTLSFSKPEEIRSKLQELCDKHFPTPAFDRAFDLISWIILCISLPATVAGYIGCFTLVSNSKENGPLIWLGLESSLSFVRILIWAWNPSFDETDIPVKLKLTEDQPFVTTEKGVEVIESTGHKTLSLVPERRFLEWITSYTGPLEQFQSSENLALYFTLTARGHEQKCLYMTVFDLNKQIAVTLLQANGGMKYIDAIVTYNRTASKMQAVLRSAIDEEHPQRTNDVVLFDALAIYYMSLIRALNRNLHSPLGQSRPDVIGTVATVTLQRKWNLLPKHPEHDKQNPVYPLEAPSLHDQLYLGRGDEHHLKTLLIENWREWIIEDMKNILWDARYDCHHYLADKASENAKWELAELDLQSAWEWTRRALSLLVSSIALEGILHERMKECIEKVTVERGNGRLKDWMWSEFAIGQRKRLEKERGEMKERMEKEMKDASDIAEIEGRPWRDQGKFGPRWEVGLKFMDEQWSTAIEGGALALKKAVSELDQLVKKNAPRPRDQDTVEEKRFTILKQVKQRFEQWYPQRGLGRREMDTAIKCIRDAEGKHLDDAYHCLEPDLEGIYRFSWLICSSSRGKFCSAIVYDAYRCDNDVVLDVIKKSTTRSVIGVDPDLIDSIPENDHLLYIDSPTGKEPAFIRRNRDLWWDQQTGNSSTFYFSPQGVVSHGRCVSSVNTTIAHIFIFLVNPSRIRLRLLHSQSGHGECLSVQENGKEIRRISTNEIKITSKYLLQDYELYQFKPGRHELELVPCGEGYYHLRDILIEFFDDPPSGSSVDKEDGNLAARAEHGGAHPQPSGISDTDLGAAIENNVCS